MRYALVSTDGKSVVRFEDHPADLDPAAVRKCDDGFAALRPVIVMPDPPFDAGTQILSDRYYRIKPSHVECYKKIHQLTEGERKDAIKAEVHAAIRSPAAVEAVLFDLASRVRALEGLKELSLREFRDWLLKLKS